MRILFLLYNLFTYMTLTWNDHLAEQMIILFRYPIYDIWYKGN